MQKHSVFQSGGLADKRVLVTGADGFIGRHLIHRIAALGADVAALDRNESSVFHADYPCTYISCNLIDAQKTISAIFEFAPEILIHLASCPDGNESHEQLLNTIESNIRGTANVLEGFYRAGGKVIVFGDSTKDYGNSPVPYRATMADAPISSYSISKSAGWQICKMYQRLYNISAVSIRPTLIYGPGQPFNLIRFIIETVLSGSKEARLMGGGQTRDPLYVDDAVDAYILAALNGACLRGRVINIGGGIERSVANIAREIIRFMDSNIPVVLDESKMRPTDMMRSYCDNEEAAKLLGWEPVTGFKEGICKVVDSIRSSFEPVFASANG